MKTSKLAMVGMVCGFLVVVLSIVFTILVFNRYYLTFPDLDKLVAYILLGCIGIVNGILISSVAYLHEVTVKLKITQQNIENGLAELYRGKNRRWN